MDNLKLISVRISKKDADRLQQCAAQMTYYRVSDIYRQAISLAAYMAEHGGIEKLMHFYPDNGDVMDEFVFKYHRTIG